MHCDAYGYHAAACESLSSEPAPSAPTSERRWRAAGPTSTSSRAATTSRPSGQRGQGAVRPRRLRGAPARDRRPVRDRAGRLRLPRPEGELVRDLRRAARPAPRRRHGGHRRPERHPLVVLPRRRRAVRRAPDRDRRPGRRRHEDDPARARDRLRRLRGHRARGAGRRPPSRGHAVHDRRAEPDDVRPLPAVQRGDDRGRPEVPDRAGRARRDLGQAHGQRRVQPAERADPGDDGGDLPARRGARSSSPR